MNSKLLSFDNLRKDIPAGLVVFLVALPLCLGVALASGAPILSGVISGVVGGIVVGLISNSQISVSGPAAGLTAIVASSIMSLGRFDIFLMAVVISGLFQIISGIAKTGFIADYIPSNVIKGLLAAIGIILILKQIPHAVGYDKDYEGDFSFFQQDNQNTFSELINMLNYFSAGAALIAIISILILVFWGKSSLKNIVPAPLLVVVFGILANTIFKNFLPSFYINESHLVNIPEIKSFSSIITLPDFSSVSNLKVWTAAITIAIVASLETLLNLEAVERLDTQKRQSSRNRELIAQGVGNSISGLLGGIPLTSVIVRSSVNIDIGAKTKISTILHGFFLLVFVLFAVPLLNLIPLSSLAAILIFTGYKLAKLSIFKEMLKKGWNQFIPFVATIFSIVFTDLLIGIIIGLVVSIFFLLKSNLNYPSIMKKDVKYKEEIYNLTLSNQVSFLNKSGIKKALWNIPKGSMITIDAVNCDFIDNDVLEIIDEFKNTVSKEKKIQLNILGLKEKYKLDDQIDFIDYLDKDTLNTLSPEDILQILQDGNDRFVSGKGRRKDYTKQVEAGSTGQNPMAVFVSCIDSRTSPEIIFDLGLGDILSIRIAGNIINEDILGSIELACQKLGAKLVVVLGHSECGAIATAINKFDEGFIGSVMQKIEKAVDQCGCDRLLLLENNEAFNNVVKQNTLNSYHDIVSQSEYLKNAKENGKIDIVSGYYDLKTGIVSFEKHQS